MCGGRLLDRLSADAVVPTPFVLSVGLQPGPDAVERVLPLFEGQLRPVDAIS